MLFDCYKKVVIFWPIVIVVRFMLALQLYPCVVTLNKHVVVLENEISRRFI